MIGLCECGCGEQTKVATRNDRSTNRVKGRPMRFVPGHQGRVLAKQFSAAAGPEYEERDCGHDTRCWVWLRSFFVTGYGQTRRNAKPTTAHRAFWEDRFGSVPDGLDLDHLCRNRACCNPDHLEPVTRSENIRRGFAARAVA